MREEMATVRVGWAGVLSMWLLASVAVAEDSDARARYVESLRQRSAEWEAARADEDSLKKEWQERYRRALVTEKEARAQLEKTRASRVHAYKLGAYAEASPAEWTERWEQAQEDFRAAEAELAALPDEARREGVPPGWLREVESSVPRLDRVP